MIVLLANETPWPVRNGGRGRIAGLVRALRPDHEVRVVVTRRTADAEVHDDVIALPVSRRSKAAALLGTGPRLGRGLLDPAVVAELRRQCIGARALIVSHSYLAAELPPWDVPVIVDLPNLETQRGGSKGGWIACLEAAKARRWEPAVVRAATAVVCVDEADAVTARSWGARTAVVVPNVAEVPVSLPSPDEGSVLLVGDWTYGPNADSLRPFLEHVAPRLPRGVVLAGRGSEQHGGLGFVDDISPLYDGAAVVVSPVERGAGTQLKVVEALTRGRVVVTGSYGSRSVPAAVTRGAVIADGAELMIGAIRGLLDDPADRHAREAELRAAPLPRTWEAAGAPLRATLAAVRDG